MAAARVNGGRSVRHRSQQGRDAELEAMRSLGVQGWLCGSRRHMLGAGDFVAVRPFALVKLPNATKRPIHEVRLVEVKTTAQSPYERFGPDDRSLLLEAAHRIGAEAWIAWRPPKAPCWAWLPSPVWPKNDPAPETKESGAE